MTPAIRGSVLYRLLSGTAEFGIACFLFLIDVLHYKVTEAWSLLYVQLSCQKDFSMICLSAK